MIINYCTYNTRTNTIIDKDLDSYEAAIKIAATYPDYCVASNTIYGLKTGQEWATNEFFDLK